MATLSPKDLCMKLLLFNSVIGLLLPVLIEELFFRGYESTVKALEENGYQRVLPKEVIEFPQKKRKRDLWVQNLKIVIPQ